uniref:Uncharacterized protein n=1 Tax=Romanomermis culicivorax TaxID=13658 RepID=A0A915HJ61_ROMCU
MKMELGALRNSKPHFVKKIGKFRLRTEQFVSEITKFSLENPKKYFVNEVLKFRQRTVKFVDELRLEAPAPGLNKEKPAPGVFINTQNPHSLCFMCFQT